MSRAYCLTCNEQVAETPAGTCPAGHPVTTDDVGPEPWVGFVGDDTAGARPAPAIEAERPAPVLSRIDAAGEPLAHATNGAAVNGHVNGHVNGDGHANGNGRSLGGGQGGNDPFPSTFGHRSSFTSDEDTTPTERAPASGQASDDLAALLAEALGSAAPAEDEATPAAHEDAGPPLFDHAPTPQPEVATETAAHEPAPAEPAASEDWDDLASLAAELQLDADQAHEDPTPPVDAAPAAPVTPVEAHAPVEPEAPAAPGDELAAADLDALMAELTGEPMPAEADPAPPAPALESAPEAPAAAMPPPTWDPVAPGDAPPPPEPVPSAPSAPESATPWDAPAAPVGDHSPWEDPSLLEQPDASPYDDVPEAPAPDPAAAPLDLTNFTASGRRVGQAGPAVGTSKKKMPFGRKR